MDLSELDFDTAMWEFTNKGRRTPLIAYLHSDKPLHPGDRKYLADYLEGKVKRPRGRPRGGSAAQQIRFLAGLVRAVKAELREQGEFYRIHNKAVDRVLTAYPVGPVDREKLENHLRRSQRKPRKK